MTDYGRRHILTCSSASTKCGITDIEDLLKMPEFNRENSTDDGRSGYMDTGLAAHDGRIRHQQRINKLLSNRRAIIDLKSNQKSAS